MAMTESPSTSPQSAKPLFEGQDQTGLIVEQLVERQEEHPVRCSNHRTETNR